MSELLPVLLVPWIFIIRVRIATHCYMTSVIIYADIGVKSGGPGREYNVST